MTVTSQFARKAINVLEKKVRYWALLTMSCARALITDSTGPVMNTVPFLCVPFGSGNVMLKNIHIQTYTS